MKFEIPTPNAQTAEAHSSQEEFTLLEDSRGRWNIGFGQLTSKKWVFGEFATSSLTCVRATSGFFSRGAASASIIFANGRR
jgi:hypothetical protein